MDDVLLNLSWIADGFLKIIIHRRIPFSIAEILRTLKSRTRVKNIIPESLYVKIPAYNDKKRKMFPKLLYDKKNSKKIFFWKK